MDVGRVASFGFGDRRSEVVGVVALDVLKDLGRDGRFGDGVALAVDAGPVAAVVEPDLSAAGEADVVGLSDKVGLDGHLSDAQCRKVFFQE